MTDGDLDNTLVAADARPFEGLAAVAVADLLLTALVRRRATHLSIEPGESRHCLRMDDAEVVATFSPAKADAVVARLALIAGLDLGDLKAPITRMRVGESAPGERARVEPVELWLAIRATPRGLQAELRRPSVRGESLRPPRGLPPPQEDEPGDIGSYRLLGELGRGGMGIVYRAEHVVLGRLVALKVLRPELAENAAHASQFVQEARAASRIRHPSVVEVTDFGTAGDGRGFIVMELVEGPTLAALLAGGPLEPLRALSIARHIAGALGVASAHGVVHRDLKPGNVFVLAGERIKLADFGVACIVDGASLEVRREKGIVGTAAYMAPEQGLEGVSDERSDLYSLGCVLFEMLTGKLPFQGPTVVATLEQHATSPLPPMSGPEGPIPDVVERVVLRAMAKRREERYQTAEEMLADLRNATRSLERGGWRRWLPR